MGATSECIDQEHEACIEAWCDCGCHHDLIDAHHEGKHTEPDWRCQECVKAVRDGTTDARSESMMDIGEVVGWSLPEGTLVVEDGEEIPQSARSEAEAEVVRLTAERDAWRALAQSRARGMRTADLDQELDPSVGVPSVAALRALGVTDRDLGRD